MDELFIGVINLDRRPDRMLWVESQLDKAGIQNWTRIPAIDGSVETAQTRLGVSNFQGACWLSHQRTFEAFLDSGKKFALVVEDDVMVTVAQEASRLIDSSILAMEENGVNVLQLGFWPRRESLTSRIAKFRSGRYFSSNGYRFVKHEFLNGTFCYLISREGAQQFLGLNVPVARAADEFLEDLARQSRISNWGIWRVTKSPFQHATGGQSRKPLDSDVHGISHW